MADKKRERMKAVIDAAEKVKRMPGVDEETKEELDRIRDMATGTLLTKWLPTDTPKRFVVAMLFATAVLGAVLKNIWFLLLLVPIAFMSPRIVGGIAYALGRLFGPPPKK